MKSPIKAAFDGSFVIATSVIATKEAICIFRSCEELRGTKQSNLHYEEAFFSEDRHCDEGSNLATF